MGSKEMDLVVLVADKYMEVTLDAILSNQKKLGISEFDYKVYRHPEHDPGCYIRSQFFLENFKESYKRCLVVFDHDGCGNEEKSRIDLESEVKEKLNIAGWDDRNEVIVIDPELESWVWSDSPVVKRFLGWEDKSIDLQAWLQDQELWEEGDLKPKKPKTAVERVLFEVRKSNSAFIYKKIAERVSYNRCSDPAFAKLVSTLKKWYG